jgi:ribulose-phosphate 3-epimerase
VQIDVIDGVYDNDISWPYKNEFADFEEIEMGDEGLPMWQDFDFEFDLMIQNTAEETERFLKAGASAIILHFESFKSREALGDAISIAQDYEVQIGIALKPKTPNAKIHELIPDIDFVQFMGSDDIGHHGVELENLVYKKISDLHTEFPNTVIGVDIGVNFETAPRLIKAGATRLVAGSAIFNSDNIGEAIKRLGVES